MVETYAPKVYPQGGEAAPVVVAVSDAEDLRVDPTLGASSNHGTKGLMDTRGWRGPSVENLYFHTTMDGTKGHSLIRMRVLATRSCVDHETDILGGIELSTA